jgi:putative membrane protein
MVHHIALMNVLAPVSAVALAPFARDRLARDRGALLWTATCFQIALLWAWHAPRLHEAAAASSVIHAAMLTSLLVAALCFWGAILLLSSRSRWQAIVALLATGKLACLLGVLLVFAPRLLYPIHASSHSGHAGIEDQQLAGLLMLIACPLSYVLAGVVLSAQIVYGLHARAVVADRPDVAAVR